MSASALPSRTTRECLLGQVIGAGALTVAAVSGAGAGLAGAAVWVLAYLSVTTRAGLAGLRAGRGVMRSTGAAALALGLPFMAAFGALAPAIVNPEYRVPALASGAIVVIAGWIAIAVVLGRLESRTGRTGSLPSPPAAERATARRLLAALVTVLVFSVPLMANAASRRTLEGRVQPCGEMHPQVRGASQMMLRILAEACGQRDGEVASQRVGETRIDVYPGARNADIPAVVYDARSIVAHLTDLLGSPGIKRVAISPVAIPGSVRGMAGPGYLLIDSAELISPRACRLFRASAGTDGTCGRWVLAHELAHMWFPGTAHLGPSSDQVAWEATADYLAWDWWRHAFGEADAVRLQEELFEGRMGLAREFAAAHAPGDPPANLAGSQGRALIYGRGPLGWIAAERESGRDSVRAVLRGAFAGTRGGVMTMETILDGAEPYPDVAGVLDRWWLDPSFDPALP